MTARDQLANAVQRGCPDSVVNALLKAARMLRPGISVSFAQEGEDIVLRRLLEGRDGGFYVDVGAHHPTRFSNTRLFYDMGWRGINVEPSPEVLREFERQRPRDRTLNLGIAEHPGTLTFYVFDEPALNTFDEALKRKREAHTSYRVVRKRQVPVERLDRILEQHLPAGQQIDFLTVDVEGLDLQVLKSNDWGRFRPDYVLTEALDFRLERAEGNPTHAFMHGVGYELVAKTLNTLFYRSTR